MSEEPTAAEERDGASAAPGGASDPEDRQAGEGPNPAPSPAAVPETARDAGAEDAAEAGAETARDAGAEDAAEAVADDLDELAAARQERDSYLELAQRTKADFDNYRKRVAKEAAEAEGRGRAGLARELIPALDNLERALRAAGVDPDAAPAGGGAAGESEEVSARDALAQGVALVLGELRATLQRAGVEAYDPAGERFDPAWHEALSTVPAADGAEAGTVVETLERGYRLAGQVLRPARVVVSE